MASGPGSFMQANFGAMDAALAAIAAHVPLGSAVADLHCGVGTIGGLRWLHMRMLEADSHATVILDPAVQEASTGTHTIYVP